AEPQSFDGDKPGKQPRFATKSRLSAPPVVRSLPHRFTKEPGMPKVLMPIGDATEVLDTLYPFFRLPEDGFEVVVAGPEARLYHGVMHEIPPNENIPWDITREQPAYHVKATIAVRDVQPADYAGLLIS